MIAELIKPAKIIFGVKGDFPEAIDSLCRRSVIPQLGKQFHGRKAVQPIERYSYIGNGIAVPHLRVENLSSPELILGLSPEGIPCNN